MPTDAFGWVLAIYWPVCFLTAAVLSFVLVKKPITRELLTVGFALLLLVVIAQRLFYLLAFPAEGEPTLPFELISASTAIFGLGDLIAYVVIFFALVVPGKSKGR